MKIPPRGFSKFSKKLETQLSETYFRNPAIVSIYRGIAMYNFLFQIINKLNVEFFSNTRNQIFLFSDVLHNYICFSIFCICLLSDWASQNIFFSTVQPNYFFFQNLETENRKTTTLLQLNDCSFRKKRTKNLQWLNDSGASQDLQSLIICSLLIVNI